VSGLHASHWPLARRWLCRSWTERCAGLDVHQKTVVAGVVTPTGQETRTFSTMTIAVLALSDWLLACGCPHIATESTGDYWQPVCTLVEGTCEGTDRVD